MNIKFKKDNPLATALCTITTQSHLFKVQALFASLEDKTDAEFHCLITDGDELNEKDFDFKIHHLNSLQGEQAERIKKKYTGNKLRWACKPLLLTKFLSSGYESAIYVDNDINFYSSPDFLFEQLKTKSILLTPHYYPADPTKDQNWMEANFRVGLYNGGFIGANKDAVSALKWWADCCIYNIKKLHRRGLFDDQKYLDLFPVLFENVEILKHKGCNVAGWNIQTSPRSKNAAGEIFLDGKWPLIFVHYNYYTIEQCIKNKDPMLKEIWEEYCRTLKKYDPNYNPNEEIKSFGRNFEHYIDYIRYRIDRLGE